MTCEFLEDGEWKGLFILPLLPESPHDSLDEMRCLFSVLSYHRTLDLPLLQHGPHSIAGVLSLCTIESVRQLSADGGGCPVRWEMFSSTHFCPLDASSTPLNYKKKQKCL